MYYFILGIVLMVIGLWLSVRHPRKWRIQSNIAFIAGMVLILFATFTLRDPIEGIPNEIMVIIQIVVTFGGFYGFLYKIEHDLRNEFGEKLRDLKADIHRDIDRIERILEIKK